MKNKKSLWIIIAIVAFMVLWAVSAHNKLVKMDESVNAQWANVEAAYQRRADLIPNLVSTVKGYADFEQETLTQVIEARAKATSVNINADNLTPQSIQQFEAVQGELSSALSRLLVTIERYPELKANQNFLELQSQLEGTENRITFERTKFNKEAQGFNSSIRQIPRSLIARMAGFEKKAYFQSSEGSETAPSVSF